MSCDVHKIYSWSKEKTGQGDKTLFKMLTDKSLCNLNSKLCVALAFIESKNSFRQVRFQPSINTKKLSGKNEAA